MWDGFNKHWCAFLPRVGPSQHMRIYAQQNHRSCQAMQQQHIHTEKPMNAKNVGKYLVSALLLFQVTFPTPKTVILWLQSMWVHLLWQLFLLIVWGFSQENIPEYSECGKSSIHPYLSGLIGSMLEKNPSSIRSIREPFVIAPPWFHMGRLTWGRNALNPVNVDSPSAFIYSCPSLRVFILRKNPVSIRNGPKPYTYEPVSGTIRELILGKNLLNVTPGENLLNRGSIILWGIIPKRNNCSYAVRKSSEISHHLLSLEESYRKWIHPRTLHLRIYKGERTVATVQFQKSSTIALPLLCTEKAATGIFKKQKQRRKENISRYNRPRNVFMTFFLVFLRKQWQFIGCFFVVVVVVVFGWQGRCLEIKHLN